MPHRMDALFARFRLRIMVLLGSDAFAELVVIAVGALVIASLIRFFIAEPFVVSGPSMSPTLEPGDYLVIDRLSYRFAAFERGDIIVFRYPLDVSSYFIKRIVGLPGETIEIGDGAISLVTEDGARKQLLEGPFPPQGKRHDRISSVTLGADEYFVVGDNRDASDDSRDWGPLRERYIVGRVRAQLLPLSDLSITPGAFEFNTEVAH
ncbi:signal peptidase I [Candidatus Kaiserbacteria bacterium]|nr:signal peptidase I [Candidatus Kaiserbacteria bacterium]